LVCKGGDADDFAESVIKVLESLRLLDKTTSKDLDHKFASGRMRTAADANHLNLGTDPSAGNAVATMVPEHYRTS